MKRPYDDASDFSDFLITGAAAGSSNAVGTAFGHDPGPATGSPIVVGDEELEAEAAVAASGPGGTGSVVAVGGPASAGLTINLMFDAAAMAAPQSFRDGITQAMQMICAVVTDKITINLQIDYSGKGGGAAGGPSGGFYEPYSTVRGDLVNNASPGDTTFNALPTGSSISGQTQVAVWDSQLKLWGLLSPTGTEIDGSATFATDINPNLLIGVALHELTHAMGRVPYGPSSGQTTITQPDIFDFYRFTSAGNILIDGAATAPAAYFSLDGGATKIADYGQTSDPSDYLNSGLQGSTDPFNEFYSSNTQQQLTAIDLKQLDALGFHLLTNQQTTTVIEAKGVTELVQVGNNYFLDPIAGGTGPELKISGAAVTVGQFGTYLPIAAEATGNGYEVAFKDSVSGQFSIWSVDSNGNYLSNIVGIAAGNTTAVESQEPVFHQDLNGDGIIGVPPPQGTVIEAIGSTELVQVGSNYFLDPVAGGTGPELKISGSAVTAGQFGTYLPIAAEAAGSGYEVAFKDSVSGQFSIWSVDSNGNYLSNIVGIAAGNTTAVESQEPVFQQDLNGDGIIGVPASTAAVMTSTEPAAGFNFRADLGANQGATGTVDASSVHSFFDFQANSLASLVDNAHSEQPLAIGGHDAEIGVAKIFAGHLDHFHVG